MRSHSRARPRRTGFTLVELMIALAVMAILAALAWPALQEAVQKSRRADGMSALANIMQAQERWRANNPVYQATLADLPGAQNAVSGDQHYDLSLVAGTVTATGFTARATARAASPQSSDSRCQVLQVAVTGGTIVYSSLAGGVANATPDPCWVR
ncbi:MAG: type IV pilin protein [Pseudomonadota bacterium]